MYSNFILIKKEVFYSEDNKSLEQPPQECGGVPITGSLQDVNGQGAGLSYPGSPSHERLDIE